MRPEILAKISTQSAFIRGVEGRVRRNLDPVLTLPRSREYLPHFRTSSSYESVVPEEVGKRG